MGVSTVLTLSRPLFKIENNMDFYLLCSRTGISFLVSEIITLSSSEAIVQLVCKEVNRKQRPLLALSLEFKARVVQEVLLILLWWAFSMFAHIPCLLLTCLAMVTVRLLVLKCYRSRNFRNVSKRLQLNKQYFSQGRVAFQVDHTPTLLNSVNRTTFNDHHTPRPMPMSFQTPNSMKANPDLPRTTLTSQLKQSNPQQRSVTPPRSIIRGANWMNRGYQSQRVTHFSPLYLPQYYNPSPVHSNSFHPKGSSASTALCTSPALLPPGICNTGNICFLSSIIQCLASVDGLSFSILPRDCENEKYTSLVVSLHQVLKQTQMWELSHVNVTSLLESVSFLTPDLVAPRKQGKYQSQQDAGEFLLWLLDNLHMAYKENIPVKRRVDLEKLEKDKEDLLKKVEETDSNDIAVCCSLFHRISTIDKEMLNIRDMSDIYRLFCGQVLEARECQKCKRMSINIEYYTMLPLPVPNSNVVLSLLDCFTLFGEVENLFSENNLLFCSFCSQNMTGECEPGSTFTPGKRLALFSTLPKKLVIQLTRFVYDAVNNVASKNQSPVVFPVTGLDLFPFTIENKLAGSQQYLYSLTGFCVHTGAQSTSHGHYVAYTKVKDGTWYRFNDNHIASVKDIHNEIKSPFVLQNAYVLFYSLNQQ